MLSILCLLAALSALAVLRGGAGTFARRCAAAALLGFALVLVGGFFSARIAPGLPSAGAWFSSGLLFLGVAPAALAVLTRALPEWAGRPLPEEGAARFGLAVLLLFGGWAGAARIATGPVPVPAWVGTAGIAGSLLLVATAAAWLAVLLPLLREGGAVRIAGAPGGGFLLMAAWSFPAWIFLAVPTAFRGIGSLLHGTLFDAALDDLALFGLGGMAALGLFAGKTATHRAAFWLATSGALVRVGGEMVGGVLQALCLADPALSNAAMGSLLHPFLWLRGAGTSLFAGALLVFGLGLGRRQGVAATGGGRRPSLDIVPLGLLAGAMALSWLGLVAAPARQAEALRPGRTMLEEGKITKVAAATPEELAADRAWIGRGCAECHVRALTLAEVAAGRAGIAAWPRPETGLERLGPVLIALPSRWTGPTLAAFLKTHHGGEDAERLAAWLLLPETKPEARP